AEGTKDKYPFDLQTDRYFVYDAAEPGKKLPAFLDALRSTLASIGKDSPVFQLLPRLKPHDRQALMVVPWDFQEDVEPAQKAGLAGDSPRCRRRLAAASITAGGAITKRASNPATAYADL